MTVLLISIALLTAFTLGVMAAVATLLSGVVAACSRQARHLDELRIVVARSIQERNGN